MNVKLLSRFSDMLLVGDAIGERYAADWGGVNAFKPCCVARPKCVEDLARLMAFCHGEGIAVVTQGGMSGLSGGATPQRNELALSTELLSGIVELDTASMTITARAGTPLEQLQKAAQAANFLLPLDLGARGTATIGGNVATNAGGNAVINYGMTRALVLGLQAVLADGTIINANNKMLKNNAGYDLKQLFIGSEGTLGIVSEVTLRLFPQAKVRNTALCAFNSFDQVIVFLQLMQASLNKVTAFETMWLDYYQMSLRFNPNLVSPFSTEYPLYVLLQADGVNERSEKSNFEQALHTAMEAGIVLDAVIAQSQTEAGNLWQIRDGIAAILGGKSKLANFDIGVPISRMQAFVAAVYQQLHGLFSDLTIGVFGHIADGNLHIAAWTGNDDDVEKIYREVYRLIGEHEGTITAEHGVGMSKKGYLRQSRSEEEIELMRVLKRALDPDNILNPGRIFDV